MDDEWFSDEDEPPVTGDGTPASVLYDFEGLSLVLSLCEANA